MESDSTAQPEQDRDDTVSVGTTDVTPSSNVATLCTVSVCNQPYSESSSRQQRGSSNMSSSLTSKVSLDKPQQKGRHGNNAARERSRVKTLKMAFLELQRTLPAVPRDTKLSKLDVLVLATTYIAHLTKTLAATAPCVDCTHGYHQDMEYTNIGFGARAEGQACCFKVMTSSRGGCRGQLVQHDCRSCGSGCGGRGVCGYRVRKASVPCTRSDGYLHPVKKWPMRTRLYAGIVASARDVTKK